MKIGNIVKDPKRWNVNTPIEKLKERIEFLIENIKKDNIKINYRYAHWVQQMNVDIFVDQVKTRGYSIFLASVRERGEGYFDYKDLSDTLIKMYEI